jgi:hypothetical protein
MRLRESFEAHKNRMRFNGNFSQFGWAGSLAHEIMRGAPFKFRKNLKLKNCYKNYVKSRSKL